MDIIVGAVATTPGRLDNIITPIVNWIRSNESYGPICFEEVELDIKILKRHKNLSRQEKREDPFLRKIMNKYDGAYCPDSRYKRFTKKDKYKYFCLRLQIDELLQR